MLKESIFNIANERGKKMSFEEFLATYDIIDFIWEIFKGVSPTIIALVTIWINSHVSKKHKKEDDFLVQVKELQLMASELMAYALNTGKDLIDAIQHTNEKEKCERIFEDFYANNNKMLIEARKFLGYANVRAEIYQCKNMEFTDVCDVFTNYSYELLNILEKYNEKAILTPIDLFDELCDEVQIQSIDASKKVEEAIYNYCVQLGK